MNASVMRVIWYHFAATFRRSLPSYLTLVVLIGLVGGIAMASISAARRTQSSYPTFLSSTNPSALTFSIFGAGTGAQQGPPILNMIEKLPGVSRVRSLYAPPIAPIAPNGAAELSTLNFVVTAGSTNGELVDQDRLAVTSGHGADPNIANQLVMTASAARIEKVHVGESFPIGLFGPQQQRNPAIGSPSVKPALRVQATLVGIVELNTQVVQDGVDSVYGFVFVTPALMREVRRVDPSLSPISYAIQLAPGETHIAKIEGELNRLVPKGDTSAFHVTSQIESQVELAIKPESVALGAFGLIAALACLVLALQAITRLLHAGDGDRRILRSLGASPVTTVLDGLIGIVGAVVLGSVVAIGVAVALSPLGPIGPVRTVYPDNGVAFDATILGVGAAILTIGLSFAPWHSRCAMRQTVFAYGFLGGRVVRALCGPRRTPASRSPA